MRFLIRSVNVGTPRERDWAGIGRTSIDKRPVAGRVRATTLGLEGDQVSDTKHHGGVDQAVYAFAREDLDRWTELLGQPVRDGGFGENLTTVGYDVNAAVVGERWRIGSAVLEVASIRIPCNDFKGWMGHEGFDNTAWVKVVYPGDDNHNGSEHTTSFSISKAASTVVVACPGHITYTGDALEPCTATASGAGLAPFSRPVGYGNNTIPEVAVRIA